MQNFSYPPYNALSTPCFHFLLHCPNMTPICPHIYSSFPFHFPFSFPLDSPLWGGGIIPQFLRIYRPDPKPVSGVCPPLVLAYGLLEEFGIIVDIQDLHVLRHLGRKGMQRGLRVLGLWIVKNVAATKGNIGVPQGIHRVYIADIV